MYAVLDAGCEGPRRELRDVVDNLNGLKRRRGVSLIEGQRANVVCITLEDAVSGLLVVLAADMHKLVRRVPFRLVEVERVLLRDMVALD